MLNTFCLKVPREVVRWAPREMVGSGKATYKDHAGRLDSAFAADETVFRLTLRMPNTDRGFGFIQPANGQDNMFFHRTALVDVALEKLRQGDRVTY